MYFARCPSEIPTGKCGTGADSTGDSRIEREALADLGHQIRRAVLQTLWLLSVGGGRPPPEADEQLQVYLKSIVDPILNVMDSHSVPSPMLILDWHYVADPASYNNSKDVLKWEPFKKCTERFWKVAAQSYGAPRQAKTRVAFELFNEPVLDENGKPENLMGEWMGGLRTVAEPLLSSPSLILLGAAGWSYPREEATFDAAYVLPGEDGKPRSPWLQVSHHYVGEHGEYQKELRHLCPEESCRLPVLATELGFPQRVYYTDRSGWLRRHRAGAGAIPAWNFARAAKEASRVFDWYEQHSQGWVAWVYGFNNPNLLRRGPLKVARKRWDQLPLSDYGDWLAARLVPPKQGETTP